MAYHTYTYIEYVHPLCLRINFSYSSPYSRFLSAISLVIMASLLLFSPISPSSASFYCLFLTSISFRPCRFLKYSGDTAVL